MTKQNHQRSRPAASGIHPLTANGGAKPPRASLGSHLTLVSMVVRRSSLCSRAVRCPQSIYCVSNRELQQESLRLGRRSFVPHAAHSARLHSKDVLLNLVLPYDMFTSSKGLFGCIQSTYDHWAWGACGAALQKLLCALVCSQRRSFASKSSRTVRVLS